MNMVNNLCIFMQPPLAMFGGMQKFVTHGSFYVTGHGSRSVGADTHGVVKVNFDILHSFSNVSSLIFLVYEWH